ncbi:MAG TPA: damage-inducible protein [Stellaceae bacterium]|nr:damage-inducible protein [Stellaceae bacterium]
MPGAVALAALRSQIRRIERPAAGLHGVLPFGAAALDRALPQGGLALGAVHEILGQGGDEEDGAAAAGFAAGILARLGRFPVLWCLKRPDLYGPGLAANGLDPARLVLVSESRDERLLWAVEEGLRTGHGAGLAAVVGEIGALPMVASRRLQLAAERSGVTALLLRRWRSGAEAAAERGRPSAAVTRWRVSSLPAAAVVDERGAGEPGIGRPRWRVELLRCRGGRPGSWEVEAADATGHVCISAELADRPAAPRQTYPSPLRRAG